MLIRCKNLTSDVLERREEEGDFDDQTMAQRYVFNVVTLTPSY